MKKQILLLSLLCLWSFIFKAQDTLYLKNGKKVAVTIYSMDEKAIYIRLYPKQKGHIYRKANRHIVKIIYRDSSEAYFIKHKPAKTMSYKQLMDNHFDSIFVKRNFVRFYISDLKFYKISLGYERLLNKDYSFEIDVHYRFRALKGLSLFSKYSDYYYPLSMGCEVKMGISRHLHLKGNRASAGIALSYGEQGFSKQSFTNDDVIAPGYYSLTHKRRAIGTFLKLNYQFQPQRSGFETFISVGFYSVYTHNTYHSYQNGNTTYRPYYTGNPDTYTTDPDKIPKFKAWNMKEGFAMMPYFNVGFSYIIKQPRKGWYSTLQRKRDSLRIHGKNILLASPGELLDNSFGLTYMRMSYKNALSYYTTASIGLKTGFGTVISNALLVEKNDNYRLTDKKFDLQLGLNYNISRNQGSFPFIGVSGRAAQFAGKAYQQAFLLNKYYLLLNTGYMLRSKEGASVLFTVGRGHYFNHYLSKDPHFRVNDPGLNSFYTSIQIGYSF